METIAEGDLMGGNCAAVGNVTMRRELLRICMMILGQGAQIARMAIGIGNGEGGGGIVDVASVMWTYSLMKVRSRGACAIAVPLLVGTP
jgi:hypothetical protein